MKGRADAAGSSQGRSSLFGGLGFFGVGALAVSAVVAGGIILYVLRRRSASALSSSSAPSLYSGSFEATFPSRMQALLDAASERAEAAHALVPLAMSGSRVVPDGGIPFVVSTLSRAGSEGFAKKEGADGSAAAAAKKGAAAAAPSDAFATPSPALAVMDVDAEHVMLLNKFPLLRQHLLIATRAFRPQAAPMDADNVAALWFA